MIGIPSESVPSVLQMIGIPSESVPCVLQMIGIPSESVPCVLQMIGIPSESVPCVLQMIGIPSQLLGCMMCVLVEWLGLNVESEVALKDVGALAKVPLDDMCKKAVEGSLRAGQFQHTHLTQATTLITAQDLSWRRLDLAK